MPDIFLRAGEASPSDVKLRDPTLADSAGGVTATPGVASLTLTTFAPTVLTPRLVTVGVATLTLTAFAPTVAAPRLVTAGVASLVTSAFAPTASTPRTVTPATASLVTTPFAPTVSTPRLVTPGVAALTLATFAPTVSVGGAVAVIVPTASLALTSYAPTVTASSVAAGPHFGGARITGPARTYTVSRPVVVRPATAHLRLITFAPVIGINDDVLALALIGAAA